MIERERGLDLAGALLPGETVDSELAEDAVHWVTVYEELIEFLDRAGVEVAPETAGRFRGRLCHWRSRCDELGLRR